MIERVFNRNGWGDMWRNGVYRFVHYHSAIHEPLGVVRGRARVQFGGEQGKALDLTAGDVAIFLLGPAIAGFSRAKTSCWSGLIRPRGGNTTCAAPARLIAAVRSSRFRRCHFRTTIRSTDRTGRCFGCGIDDVVSRRSRPIVAGRRAGDESMRDWVAFWNSQNPIYVNARHRDVHYRNVAEDVRGYVPAGATVLDYGCGHALHADRIAEVAGSLILSDAAPNVRAGLTRRFADNPTITVCSPEDVAVLPTGSVDVIVMHSVAQYLSPSEADKAFALFRRLLKPQGLFVLGDIVSPDVSTVTDAVALLRFAASNGFTAAALLGLIRTLVSDYGRLRARLGLTRYKDAEIKQKLAAAGFSATRAPHNIGHNQARTTFLARPS